MDPREFKTLAGELARAADLASCRTAINRAYYAAYNVGAEFLLGHGLSIPADAKGHGEVRNHLNNSGDRPLRLAAQKLNQLYDRRELADYVMSDAESEREPVASATVALAEGVIAILDAFPSRPLPHQNAALGPMRGWARSRR